MSKNVIERKAYLAELRKLELLKQKKIMWHEILMGPDISHIPKSCYKDICSKVRHILVGVGIVLIILLIVI